MFVERSVPFFRLKIRIAGRGLLVLVIQDRTDSMKCGCGTVTLPGIEIETPNSSAPQPSARPLRPFDPVVGVHIALS
jgi:hypothetical protein